MNDTEKAALRKSIQEAFDVVANRLVNRTCALIREKVPFAAKQQHLVGKVAAFNTRNSGLKVTIELLTIMKHLEEAPDAYVVEHLLQKVVQDPSQQVQ